MARSYQILSVVDVRTGDVFKPNALPDSFFVPGGVATSKPARPAVPDALLWTEVTVRYHDDVAGDVDEVLRLTPPYDPVVLAAGCAARCAVLFPVKGASVRPVAAGVVVVP